MPQDDLFPMPQPRPTAKRPLKGQTVLLVEDSLTASESLRLMCNHSGARLRRADCLASARRHLAVYLPSILLVDMTLPDGSGANLIRDMKHLRTRLPVILALSAHLDAEGEAIAAGADGFLAKPLRSVDAFQMALLSHLPDVAQKLGPRKLTDSAIAPTPEALHHDLETAANLMIDNADGRDLDYAVKFISALARENRDAALSDAVESLRRNGVGGGMRRKVSCLLRERINQTTQVIHA
ncbi:MAG: response regulator [Rhodobacteraceae bacterium]|nr:response regulator [Paracoccaceae bacterium]